MLTAPGFGPRVRLLSSSLEAPLSGALRAHLRTTPAARSQVEGSAQASRREIAQPVRSLALKPGDRQLQRILIQKALTTHFLMIFYLFIVHVCEDELGRMHLCLASISGGLFSLLLSGDSAVLPVSFLSRRLP